MSNFREQNKLRIDRDLVKAKLIAFNRGPF